jgi:hypothetical protein
LSKFDAAIQTLILESNLYSIPCGRKRELAAAIALLEEAGKVDKARATDCLETTDETGVWIGLEDGLEQIRALLAACPEPK